MALSAETEHLCAQPVIKKTVLLLLIKRLEDQIIFDNRHLRVNYSNIVK